MSLATDNWCLIESDPGVFTELLRGYGVKGLQVEELYSLDDSGSIQRLRPLYGLIFLFKWRPGEEINGNLVADAPGVYFSQQAIKNACASQALINLLLNIDNPEVALGPTLTEFKSFTSGMDPGTRGLCLGNSDPIRTVHNSFSREHCFMELDVPRPATAKDDTFHFITYVPVGGRVYELDGLCEAPVFVGEIRSGNNADWEDVVLPHIRKRIEKYQAGEIHFNLMAIVPDLVAKYEKRIAELSAEAMETEADTNEKKSAGKTKKMEPPEEIIQLQSLIIEEEEKMKRYKIENNRRRHNYIPFIVELLKILAKEGRLVPLVKAAQEQERKKRQHKKTGSEAVAT